MMHAYYRSGQFYIPVVAKTEAGFFLDIEPVHSVPRGDVHALTMAIESVLLRGTPVVPTPSRDSFPKPVVLLPAGVKSWATFEKKSICWTITKNGTDFVLSVTGRGANGGWTDNPDNTVVVRGPDAAKELALAISRCLESRSDVH